MTLLETGAYDPQWPYVHMQPEQTVQAHQDLRGRWLLPVHNGTFDLAMHGWQEPFERVLALSGAARHRTDHAAHGRTPGPVGAACGARAGGARRKPQLCWLSLSDHGFEPAQ